jgi:hypothetical protein
MQRRLTDRRRCRSDARLRCLGRICYVDQVAIRAGDESVGDTQTSKTLFQRPVRLQRIDRACGHFQPVHGPEPEAAVTPMLPSFVRLHSGSFSSWTRVSYRPRSSTVPISPAAATNSPPPPRIARAVGAARSLIRRPAPPADAASIAAVSISTQKNSPFPSSQHGPRPRRYRA